MLLRIKRPKRRAKTVLYYIGLYPHTLVNFYGVLLNSAQDQVTNNIPQKASGSSRMFGKTQGPDMAVHQPSTALLIKLFWCYSITQQFKQTPGDARQGDLAF